MTTPDNRASPEAGEDPTRTGPPTGEPLPDAADPALRFVPGGRARVITAEVSLDRGGNATVCVALQREGRTVEVRRDAVGEDAVLLRCAAQTTIDALHRLVGPPARFSLVGAKRVPAFDSAVVMACVRTLTGEPRKLIGCVPILHEEVVLAVARAILHATNRVVETFPSSPEGDPGHGERSDDAADVSDDAADVSDDAADVSDPEHDAP